MMMLYSQNGLEFLLSSCKAIYHQDSMRFSGTTPACTCFMKMQNFSFQDVFIHNLNISASTKNIPLHFNPIIYKKQIKQQYIFSQSVSLYSPGLICTISTNEMRALIKTCDLKRQFVFVF